MIRLFQPDFQEWIDDGEETVYGLFEVVEYEEDIEEVVDEDDDYKIIEKEEMFGIYIR